MYKEYSFLNTLSKNNLELRLSRFVLPVTRSLSKFLSLKNKDRLEFYLWKCFFGSFSRHPQVSDDFSNHATGYGFGIARTSREVLHFYMILKSINKARPIRVGIDLGCGDGVALKYFSMFGLKSIGIEYDTILAEYASLNNPDSEIIVGDLTDSSVISSSLELAKELGFTPGDESGLLVYAFNPMSPNLTFDVIREIAAYSSYVLFLKNPTCRTLIEADDSLLKLELYDDGNHVVYKIGLEA